MDSFQQLKKEKLGILSRAIILSSTLGAQGSLATISLPPAAYIELFKKSMVGVIESKEADEAIISKYFAKNYNQQVDGKTIDYKGFVKHIAAQKLLIKSAKVHFIQVIAQNNVISSIHEVALTKNDGSQSLIKVIGHMTFEGDKVVKVDELTHVIRGNDQDKELGSVQ